MGESKNISDSMYDIWREMCWKQLQNTTKDNKWTTTTAIPSEQKKKSHIGMSKINRNDCNKTKYNETTEQTEQNCAQCTLTKSIKSKTKQKEEQSGIMTRLVLFVAASPSQWQTKNENIKKMKESERERRSEREKLQKSNWPKLNVDGLMCFFWFFLSYLSECFGLLRVYKYEICVWEFKINTLHKLYYRTQIRKKNCHTINSCILDQCTSIACLFFNWFTILHWQ